MSESLEHFEAIVIGTGQGGKPLASALAGAGRSVAIIERGDVGGSCVNYGCTPTKTMVASARVAHLARRSADYGIRTGEVTVDLRQIRERKRDIVKQWRQGSEKKLTTTENLELVRGEATFEDAHTLIVRSDGGQRRLRGEQIFINTGLSPVRPPIDGLEQVSTLDNASIMELEEVPRHLLVLGGGYVGLEFAQMFRRFGSRVTVIDRGDQLLKQEDADIAEQLQEVLEQEGITVYLKTSASSASCPEPGQIQLRLDGDGAPAQLSGSHLLLASGRKPNSDALKLDAAGVQVDDKGFIQVNDRLETNVEGIFAIGDVKGGPAFTHVSYNDYLVLKTNLLEGGKASIADRPLCYTVYTDPQLGRIGLNEQQAREQGRPFRLAKMPMSSVARAAETDETAGMIKAVVDAETEQILGASVLGIEGGEIMSMLEIAMMGRLPYTRLRDGMFAHPTLAESLNNLFSSFEDE